MYEKDTLAQGRDFCTQRAWGDAYESFSLADQEKPLGAEDLEMMALSAYMIGRYQDLLRALDRAHHAYLGANESVRAARCAFWLGLSILLRGEAGPATGWLSRAQRLLERGQYDCVEKGYLLLPVAEEHLTAGRHEAAYAAATGAVAIGDRFEEADLISCARHLQGRALMHQGRVDEGLAMLDEAMVAVTAGELSPLVTGLIYCSVIEACQQVYALGRAREWTSALARWCDQQPQMVAFTGTCLAHRAEIMQWHGAWREATAEARRACERFSQGIDQDPPAAAFYQQAEVHRLRGEFAAAEEAYRSASLWGWEPQPGHALLRLAQGRTDAAAAAMRRLMTATTDRMQRAKLLPACVEVMLAAGDIQEAGAACRELEGIAESAHTGVLGAMAAHARGSIELAEGRAEAALGSLRRAWKVWQQVEAPYEAARVRVLMGMACCALGDKEGGRLELDAARTVFEQLGAAPDLARIESLTRAVPSGRPHGLTPRELQVLRLVAEGKTNKVIASELFLSEKTVDRHVSNLLAKLNVPSRAAATAFAYEHNLM
jgi:DNA-binding CsgD family transcriptional regulator